MFNFNFSEPLMQAIDNIDFDLQGDRWVNCSDEIYEELIYPVLEQWGEFVVERLVYDRDKDDDNRWTLMEFREKLWDMLNEEFALHVQKTLRNFPYPAYPQDGIEYLIHAGELLADSDIDVSEAVGHFFSVCDTLIDRTTKDAYRSARRKWEAKNTGPMQTTKDGEKLYFVIVEITDQRNVLCSMRAGILEGEHIIRTGDDGISYPSISDAGMRRIGRDPESTSAKIVEYLPDLTYPVSWGLNEAP